MPRTRPAAAHPPHIVSYADSYFDSHTAATLQAGVMGFEARVQLALPLSLAEVPAGFPSPADDFMDRRLDLNEHLVRNPQATFFIRASGESMLGAGIHPGDLLVVDRSADVKSGDVVIAAVNGELTVKRLRALPGGGCVLAPEHPDYPVIEIGEDTDFEVWGRVMSVIHKV
jgi:DNA polymerase V